MSLFPAADVPVAGHVVLRRIHAADLRRRRRVSRPEEPLEEVDRVGELELSVVVRVGGIEALRLVAARE